MTELLRYAFVQNALIGALLASCLCGMVGTYVVSRRLVIAGGGMAHASLGGVGIGAYFGFSPLLGAALFAVASGFSIDALSRRGGVREDSAVAMLWTLGMSVGILFAYMAPGFMTDLPAYLFGDILSITRFDLLLLLLLLAAVGLFMALLLPAVVATAYDRDFAFTQGLPVRAIEAAMTLFTALTIVCCLHVVGIVLVISLLSIPQMTAALFVRTFRAMMWLSALVGFAACLAGLACSYLLDVPSGAAIIVVSVTFYLLARTIKQIKDGLKKEDGTSRLPEA